MSAENLKNIETHFAFGKNWASYAGLLSLPEVGFEYIDRDGAGHIGSSATSLNKLGKAKGYDLFACTITNSIYLRDNLFSKLERNRTTVEQAFDNTFVCYAFKNFASELVLSNRNLQKPCAALDMPTSRNGPNIHFPAINHFTLWVIITTKKAFSPHRPDLLEFFWREFVTARCAELIPVRLKPRDNHYGEVHSE